MMINNKDMKPKNQSFKSISKWFTISSIPSFISYMLHDMDD